MIGWFCRRRVERSDSGRDFALGMAGRRQIRTRSAHFQTGRGHFVSAPTFCSTLRAVAAASRALLHFFWHLGAAATNHGVDLHVGAHAKRPRPHRRKETVRADSKWPRIPPSKERPRRSARAATATAPDVPSYGNPAAAADRPAAPRSGSQVRGVRRIRLSLRRGARGFRITRSPQASSPWQQVVPP